MKKFIILLPILAFLFSTSPAMAQNLCDYYADVHEENLKGSIILSPDSNITFINGEFVSGQKPIIQEGRVLVPVRFIVEAFGAEVNYNSTTEKITIKHADKTITLKLNSPDIDINGQKSKMDLTATTYNNSTYIPLRYIGESLNKKVMYLKTERLDPLSLVIIRDHNGAAFENTNLIIICKWFMQNKDIIYADRYLTIFKEQNQLFMNEYNKYTSEINAAPFQYKEYVEDKHNRSLGDIWEKVDDKVFYKYFAWDINRDFVLYQVEQDNIQRINIEKTFFKTIKIHNDKIYYVLSYVYGFEGVDKTSNLKCATYINDKWVVDYLGQPGFYYGIDVSGVVHDWSVNDQGVFIFGYDKDYHLGSEERKATFGNYKVDLLGHSHEMLN